MKQIINLELTTGRKKMLLINDIFPAAAFFLVGFTMLQEGSNTILAFISIVSGCLLIIFGLKEWRSLTQRVDKKINWFEVVSGLVMIINSITTFNTQKIFQPAIFYFAIALFFILKGFSVIQIKSPFRKLTITEDGFKIKKKPFTKNYFCWQDLQKIEMENRVLRITTNSGEQKISLKGIANHEEVYSALAASLQMNARQNELTETEINLA